MKLLFPSFSVTPDPNDDEPDEADEDAIEIDLGGG
jgi:hypothetical protein